MQALPVAVPDVQESELLAAAVPVQHQTDAARLDVVHPLPWDSCGSDASDGACQDALADARRGASVAHPAPHLAVLDAGKSAVPEPDDPAPDAVVLAVPEVPAAVPCKPDAAPFAA